jgi:glycosyltransferase involved in cell wall biosynthesis
MNALERPPVDTGAALVSLVMPVWNPHPEYLRDAIASCLGQQGCRVELIVVDDGGGVDLEAILGPVLDPRLRLVRIEHGGVSRARNAGVRAATGTHFRFIDADDVIPAASTARLLELVLGSDRVIGYGTTLVGDARLRPLSELASHEAGDALWSCVTGGFDVMIPAAIFPRRVVELAGPWNEALRVHEDWEYMTRCLEHAQVRGCRDTVYLYREHTGSVTKSPQRYREAATGTAHLVEGFLTRHPEVRGSRRERRLRAMQLWFELVAETGGNPLSDRRVLRVAVNSPRRVWPAISGRIRALVRRLIGRR